MTILPTFAPAIPIALMAIACAADDGPAADKTTSDATTAEGSTGASTGPGMTTGDDDDDDDMTGTSTDDDDDDDDDDDTGPTPCEGNEDCTEGNQLFCGNEGTCVDCSALADGDAACAEVDADRPACRVDGACVQCTEGNAGTCLGVTPICDQARSECRPCQAHAECASGACKIPLGFGTNDASHGACFETSVTVGAEDLADQIELVPIGGELAIFVDDTANENEPVDIPVATHIAIIATNGSDDGPRWGGVISGPTATLEANAGLWLSGIQVRSNSSSEPAIVLDGGDLHAQASWLVENDGGSVRVDPAGRMLLENCFAGSISNAPEIELVGGDARILYSTIAGSPYVGSRAVQCADDEDPSIENSIVAVVSANAPVDCSGAVTVGSEEVNNLNTDWFADYFDGDYHLAAEHGFGTVAEWNDGDPLVDIDGDARSGIDGTAELPGADIP